MLKKSISFVLLLGLVLLMSVTVLANSEDYLIPVAIDSHVMEIINKDEILLDQFEKLLLELNISIQDLVVTDSYELELEVDLTNFDFSNGSVVIGHAVVILTDGDLLNQRSAAVGVITKAIDRVVGTPAGIRYELYYDLRMTGDHAIGVELTASVTDTSMLFPQTFLRNTPVSHRFPAIVRHIGYIADF
ncbi:MAG: hypothetical protein FWC91_07865, partial [Defluviitaleaceae bacterium]|nr:hypothetical protein [Defluviitaleaceae bacterium]